MQLHVFSHASEKAFGCAVYIRSILTDGTILVRLVCAKSRVAPAKITTLPRLELCAAVLAAQLFSRVKRDLNWKYPAFCWTDSEIVLSWINATSSSYHTFVANRIATIQELTTPNQWNHVPSKENPADLASRGVPPEVLQSCNLWLFGPLFMHAPESAWPAKLESLPTDLGIRQSKVTLGAVCTPSSFLDEIDHKNSFLHLQRMCYQRMCCLA